MKSKRIIIFAALIAEFFFFTSFNSAADKVNYTYDDAGRLIEEEYESRVVKYTYDSAGNLLQKDVTDNVSSEFQLVVQKQGTGSGTVTSSPAGINCGSDCDQNYAEGSMVTLVASPDQGSVFAGWSGGGCGDTGNCTVTMTTDVSIKATFNNMNAGTLEFSSATYKVGEGKGNVTITVTRSGGSDGAVSVDFITSNGTAMAGADYTAASGTLQWSDGDGNAKTFTVTVADDSLKENAETVNLTLSNPSGGASLGSMNTAVIKITGNDSGRDDDGICFISNICHH